MQMYTREFPPGEEIMQNGRKFREIFFITSGKIEMVNQNGEIFMQLADGNIFGDY